MRIDEGNVVYRCIFFSDSPFLILNNSEILLCANSLAAVNAVGVPFPVPFVPLVPLLFLSLVLYSGKLGSGISIPFVLKKV